MRSGAVVAGALLLSWGIRRRVRRWAQQRPEDTADLVRLRRRETAAVLLSSVSRYTLMLVATVVVLGIFLRSSLTATAGASLVAVLIGFGAQRFLQDVIAGFFILAEGQYGVGDFIVVEPMKAAGVVDELGLRTTVLRNLNGDRSVVPNGQITAVHRAPNRYRTYTVELLTSDAETVLSTLEEIVATLPVGDGRFLQRPTVSRPSEFDDGLALVEVQAHVPPTMEWLVESLLVQTITARLDDALATAPIVYTLDDSAVRRYERTIVVR